MLWGGEGKALTNDKKMGVFILFDEQELENIDSHRKKFHLKRTEFIRDQIRKGISNADPITAITKQRENSTDLNPVMESLSLLHKRVESLEKNLNSHSEGNETISITVKERIAEAILQVMQRATDPFTTTEKLAEQIKRIDPSLEQFLFATGKNGFSPYGNVLTEFHLAGKLHRSPNGIIEFKGGAASAQRKKD